MRNILKKGIREALDRESWKCLLFLVKEWKYQKRKSLRNVLDGVDLSRYEKGSDDFEAFQELKTIVTG